MLLYSNPKIRVPSGPKNPEIMKMEVSGLPNNKIEKLLIQIEAEYLYGAFQVFFSPDVP